MRTFRTLVAIAATLAMGFVTQAVSYGQTPDRPVGVLSIAPLDRLMQDFTYLTRSAGVPQFGGIGSMMTKQYTQGLDTSRPAGLTVRMVEGQPVAMAFLPVANRQTFFTALAGAGLMPDDLGNGLFSFDANGKTIYVKDAGQWLFISQQEGDFAKLPVDPSVALGDLPAKYDLATRINIQALPPELRNMAVTQMRAGFERSLAEQKEQTAEERAAAEEVGRSTIAQMERILNETEQVMFGWNATAAAQKLQIDLGAQFTEGSELAGQIGKLQNLTSDFTGLLIQGAAITLRSTALIADSDKALSKNNLRNGYSQLEKQIEDSGSLPAENKAAITKFAKAMMAVIEKTIDAGKLDGGGAVALNDNKVRAVFGGFVADGTQVEKEVKDLVASLGNGPNVPKFQFNYAKHQDVNLHKVSIPLKTDDAMVQQVFGSELRLVVGTGAKSLFVSLDPDGDSVIRGALDRIAMSKNVKVTPGEFIIEVGQVLTFAQALSPNPLLDNASQAVQQSEGKDKIRILNTLVPRGIVYQVLVDEGVLKGIGATVQAAQGGNGAGF
jgi:hypothetical protein